MWNQGFISCVSQCCPVKDWQPGQSVSAFHPITAGDGHQNRCNPGRMSGNRNQKVHFWTNVIIRFLVNNKKYNFLLLHYCYITSTSLTKLETFFKILLNWILYLELVILFAQICRLYHKCYSLKTFFSIRNNGKYNSSLWATTHLLNTQEQSFSA